MSIAICDCEITSEEFHQEINGGGANTVTAISDCDITSEGGKSHRRRVLLIGGGFNASEEGSFDRRRFLTKFQVNLVIPKNNTYGYISTKGGDMYLWGVFIIFLIWGGKIRRDLYNKVRN